MLGLHLFKKKKKEKKKEAFLQYELVENGVLNVYWSGFAIMDEWNSFCSEYNESLCAHCKQAFREPATCE